MANDDFFANITNFDNQRITEGLYEPQPPEIDEHPLPCHAQAQTAPVYQSLDTEEKLKAALTELRQRMLPFMQNHAPVLPQTRSRQSLEGFDWREETQQDQADFTRRVIQGAGDWQKVDIPHYGGPIGKATTFYRTTVTFTAEDLALGSTFVCFKGVDYIAHVYLNGACVGRHEGFFAPFEFDVSKWAKVGENVLVVRVDNDAINMGNSSWGQPEFEGDKIYGATGPGWDDPHAGWHHCPPGMGIYQDVCFEHRPTLFVHDLYIRPLVDEGRVEFWVEIYNATPLRQFTEIAYAVHGRNFDQPEITSGKYTPEVRQQPGVGDMVKPNDNKILPLACGPGVNYFKFSVDLKDFRVWTLDTPWLYQAQVSLLDDDGQGIDHGQQHFGMRSFHSDEVNEPKGRLFFNNEEIRLRGTNTMGHLQQCVIKRDWDQLIDDILLAKLCNLNFFRMTQRPVQPEIYDHFDMLGILSQTDFPLFGCLRRTQFDEALRQTREMERLLRPHPSCVIVSYMNEPFPNGDSKPHRNLDYAEQRTWYDMADTIVRQCNPERVIKAVDGDYDPPSQGISDRHCYNLWYGNHGIDFGKFHRGYWQVSKEGWSHGCGEFGVEGLDSSEVMHAHFPEEWMSARDDEGNWLPDPIPYNQTYKFHHLWYETPRGGVESWVERSHAYQKYALRHIGEAFRRDNLCVTCAVHLFIDAFPSNWMKTIMDYHRKPKGGYFGMMEAFAPVAVSIRTDRFSWYPGETFTAEAWLANDKQDCPQDLNLHYEVIDEQGNLLASGGQAACIKPCRADYQGSIHFAIPEDINSRRKLSVALTLVDADGTAVHRCQQDITVFPKPQTGTAKIFPLSSDTEGEAAHIIRFVGGQTVASAAEADTLLCDDFSVFQKQEEEVLAAVEKGARLVLLSVPNGDYRIAGSHLEIIATGMSERHTLNRNTGHPVVAELEENDLRFLHDPAAGYITPFCRSCIMPTEGLKPVITTGTGNSGFGGPPEWIPVVAAGEITHGKGSIIVCQFDIGNRIQTNACMGALVKGLVS